MNLVISYSYLIKVEWGQAFPAHGLLLCVAALLQRFVSAQEEAQPGAGGGGRVLTRQEETDQHPRDLVIAQRPSVSEERGRGVLFIFSLSVSNYQTL